MLPFYGAMSIIFKDISRSNQFIIIGLYILAAAMKITKKYVSMCKVRRRANCKFNPTVKQNNIHNNSQGRGLGFNVG